MANIQATLVAEPNLSHQESSNALRQFFSYLYFLRFSLALWLSLPGLLLLNYSLPSLAHGIFALERPTHFFYAGFFVTIAGCVALVNARITCAYGEQRFGIAPPEALNVTEDMRWKTFVLSQTPGFVVLAAVCAISIYEASTLKVVKDGLALLAGIATALAIWILISTFYYWTHRQPEAVADSTGHPIDLAPNSCSPTAFLVPGVQKLSFLLRLHKTQPPPFAQIFSTLFMFSASWGGYGYQDETLPREVVASSLWRWILNHAPFVDKKKYCETGIRPLLPGHALSLVLAFLWLLVYAGLSPFTAPVPLPTATLAATLLFTGLALLWILAFALNRNGKLEQQKHVLAGKIVEYGVPFLLLLYWPASYALLHDIWPFHNVWHPEIPIFPSIAPILMLLIISCWIFNGFAFFFDRFRMPVLTTAACLLLLLHLGVHFGGEVHRGLDRMAAKFKTVSLPIKLVSLAIPNPKDHFTDFACAPELCAVSPARAEKVITPKDILAAHLHSGHSAPLIIVTATGGGIHAAAWTAEVLAALENTFAARNQDFHSSILLISSVSGGSVGAVPFIRSYFDPTTFARMRDPYWLKPQDSSGRRWWSTQEAEENTAPPFISAASTSSLEAVSWGAVYPDMFRLLLPSRTLLGIGDLERYDRGWAMQQRMAVNMNTIDCPATSEALQVHPRFSADSHQQRPNRVDQCLTLRELSLAASGGKVPAISFNTTTAENGGRFLLANYQTTPGLSNSYYAERLLPAESFLHVYSSSRYDLPGRAETFYPDLEILAAARLSATFPYVSPMPRVPRVRQHQSVDEVFAKSLHFADGGYYDNDGTASAIEFLYEAFWNQQFATPVPILWIEIRDNGDFYGGVNPDQCTSQIASGICPQQHAGPAETSEPSAPLSQTTAPLAAFWKAGHTSVTLRNHREMAILANAFATQFRIHHAEITFHKAKEEVQPLSWHLTGREKKELLEQIRCRGPELKSIAEWFSYALINERPTNAPADPGCNADVH